MNNEIQKHQPQNQGVATFNFFDPIQFETMQRVCKLFASSELVPDMYRESEKNPLNKAMANCMIALEVAQRIGASPLMVMQNMYIVYGQPSWSSKFLIATVNTCGRFNPLKFKFTNLGRLGKVEYTEYVWVDRRKQAKVSVFDGSAIDNVQCIAYTTAKGSDEILESSPIDVKLAIQEGWFTKAGSKWPTMTRQMLTYRAASFWTSAYAPELSMGMKTSEEVYDIVDIAYEDVTEKVEKRKAESANKAPIDMEAEMDKVEKEAEGKDAEKKADTKPEAKPKPTGNSTQPKSNETLFNEDKQTPKAPNF